MKPQSRQTKLEEPPRLFRKSTIFPFEEEIVLELVWVGKFLAIVVSRGSLMRV